MNEHLNGVPILRRAVLLSVVLTSGLTSVASWGESKGTTSAPS